MPKHAKPQPANLSDAQKARLRADILAAFPALRCYEDELAFLVEEYSKDRNFVADLCKRAVKPCETLVAEANGGIATYGPGEAEFDAQMAKMDRARVEFMARQAEIAAKAEAEAQERRCQGVAKKCLAAQ